MNKWVTESMVMIPKVDSLMYKEENGHYWASDVSSAPCYVTLSMLRAAEAWGSLYVLWTALQVRGCSEFTVGPVGSAEPIFARRKSILTHHAGQLVSVFVGPESEAPGSDLTVRGCWWWVNRLLSGCTLYRLPSFSKTQEESYLAWGAHDPHTPVHPTAPENQGESQGLPLGAGVELCNIPCRGFMWKEAPGYTWLRGPLLLPTHRPHLCCESWRPHSGRSAHPESHHPPSALSLSNSCCFQNLDWKNVNVLDLFL